MLCVIHQTPEEHKYTSVSIISWRRRGQTGLNRVSEKYMGLRNCFLTIPLIDVRRDDARNCVF